MAAITPAIDLPPSTKYTDSATQEVLACWTSVGETHQLQFFTTDRFKMGVAQAQIFGEQIRAIYRIQLQAMKDLHKQQECCTPEKLTILLQFKNELEGILFGLNETPAAKGDKSEEFTLNDLIAIHNCTHINHFEADHNHPLIKLFYNRVHPISSNPNYPLPKTITMATYPGFIGVISGSNDLGVSFRVTVSGEKILQIGKPPSLFARELLETCCSLADVDNSIWPLDDSEYKPSSSHTLVTSDGETTTPYRFYPEDSSEFFESH